LTQAHATPRPRSPDPRPRAKLWRRHAAAAAGALAVNVALVLFLSSWLLSAGGAERPPLRAMPIDVTDPPAEEMAPAEAEAVVSLSPIRPTSSDLPTPPLPELPAVALSLEALPDLATDAIRLPEVAAEAPAFVPGPRPIDRRPSPPRAPVPKPPRKVAPSRGPVLLRPPDLSDYYPRRAKLRGTTGRSTVRLNIDSRGGVADVAVISSAPPGVFDRAAQRVARALRFRPALRDGRPVRSTISLNMAWRLEE